MAVAIIFPIIISLEFIVIIMKTIVVIIIIAEGDYEKKDAHLKILLYYPIIVFMEA